MDVGGRGDERRASEFDVRLRKRQANAYEETRRPLLPQGTGYSRTAPCRHDTDNHEWAEQKEMDYSTKGGVSQTACEADDLTPRSSLASSLKFPSTVFLSPFIPLVVCCETV